MRRALRWIVRSVLTIAAVIILGGAVLMAWLGMTAVSAADLPLLKDGDLVFQYSGSGQSLPILLASRSAYTHMGMVDVQDGGKAMVIEAVGPVRIIPVEDWISGGTGGRITVKRIKALDPADAERAIEAAKKYLGRPNDIFFLDGTDAIYCSELIHLAYSVGAGMSLGKVEKVGELDIDYAPVRSLIELRWQRHPLCKDGKAPSFEACYGIIMDQTLVTPASIARDPHVEMVFSNFGVAAE